MINENEWSPLIKSIVSKIQKLPLTRRLGIDSNDLFQEAWRAFLKAKVAYDADRGTKFSTYVYSVILGELHKYVRLTAVYSHRHRLESEEVLMQPLIEVVDNIEKTDLLKYALSGISESDINLLHDYYIENKPTQDIANELGKSIFTIRRRLKKLVNFLKKKIKNQNEIPIYS